jgi:Ca-activated chloride channel family protein
MTVAAPPRPPSQHEPDALFEEARQHRRRRYARVAAMVALGLAAAGLTYAVFGRGTNRATGSTGAVAAAAPSVKVVVLLVDVSGSMRADDVRPTRLQATAAAMRAFLDRVPADVAVGLVSFSTSASTVLAPTTDRQALRGAIAALQPEAGTALGTGVDSAVRVAVRELSSIGIHRLPGRLLPGLVVLESDGAQNRGPATPTAAAARARAAGIRVDGISLGTPKGSVLFGFGQTSNRIPVPPDPATVRQIATITGGHAFNATSASGLSAIYRRLAANLE